VIVLDTDVLSIVQRARGDVYERLATRLDAAGAGGVHVTVVSFEEQMRGWLAHVARARSLAQQIAAYERLQEFLDDFRLRPVLPFDDRAAAEYQRLRKAKIRIGTMDLRIAAIVLARGATLISRNLADFRRVPGLEVEDWTMPAGA
jgi:tRNA(fMet)-specific endonuclease VapC